MILAEDEKPDPILEEAVDWLLRLRDASPDSEAVRAFDAWVSSSAAHARAWKTARMTWGLMGEAPPVYRHLWDETAPVHRLPARRRRRTAAAAAIAGVVLTTLVLAFVIPAMMLRFEADHMTTTAENRVVTLEDGSRVTLGAHSAIAADMAGGERRIRLIAGEALFEVTRDPRRRFIVEAGGVDVSVLGTVFNVQLASAATMVELAEGAVAIDHAASGRAATRLAPGEIAVVDRESGVVARGTIAPDEIAAWRHGQLFINDAPIGSVVEQLQRYHPAWITLADRSLAAQRVTGLYDLNDPDRALRALVRPYGGQVREISRYIRIVSRF